MLSVSEAVSSRRSIRAFTKQPVDPETLRRVLDKARMAPSGCNFQPWEATVLTGEPLRALQAKMIAAEPQEPVEYVIQPPELEAGYLGRLQALGAKMYGAMSIGRADLDARKAFFESNTYSFGAPVLLVCHFPRYMGPPQWSDVGMWLQTIMLLLREEGLHSCPQEYMALHGRIIKEHVGVSDETHILFCGIAIGYGDMDAPVNQFERERVALDDTVRFLGF